MRNEHYLFHILGVTPESMKFVHSKDISLSPF